MPDDCPSCDTLKTDAYRERRAQIHRRYASRLKQMSARNPAYGDLWNARAAELHALRMEFYPPGGAPPARETGG